MYSFEWDSGNMLKSTTKHNISNIEAESCFTDKLAITLADEKHSGEEERYLLYGKSSGGNIIVNCFTVRDGMIRIISSRKANRKERKIYEQKQ
jgi:uncharacterized DUF497 family protein